VENLYDIAQHFAKAIPVAEVQSFGAGNVNDTFVVKLTTVAEDIQNDRFVLQRINQNVFRQPALILANMRTFTDFMRAQLAAAPRNDGRRWEVPLVIATSGGQDYLVDAAGGFWRAISMIEHAKTYPKIRDAAHARESGYALGRFHGLISDLDPNLLHDTLPGFHITPAYLEKYDLVLAQRQIQAPEPRAEDVNQGMHFVAQRRGIANTLEEARTQGKLLLRTMHGDPKVDNILIDDSTGQAVSLVDLDTVKPGLVHYDIGDCLRSCCNPAGEETTELSTVHFDLDLCRAILEGYLAEAAHFFSPSDYDYVYPAIRLIAFELGLRFFTDHLAGNVYFKVKHPAHNLDRALVQFKLVESIESQEGTIQQIVAAFRR
jgi:Ser/Thr protein kinase RdoA (MazF antagonist)